MSCENKQGKEVTVGTINRITTKRITTSPMNQRRVWIGLFSGSVLYLQKTSMRSAPTTGEPVTKGHVGCVPGTEILEKKNAAWWAKARQNDYELLRSKQDKDRFSRWRNGRELIGREKEVSSFSEKMRISFRCCFEQESKYLKNKTKKAKNKNKQTNKKLRSAVPCFSCTLSSKASGKWKHAFTERHRR